jgi:hypothetical protein
MAESVLVPVGVLLAPAAPRSRVSSAWRRSQGRRCSTASGIQRNTAADRVSAADLSLIGPQLSCQSLVGAPSAYDGDGAVDREID